MHIPMPASPRFQGLLITPPQWPELQKGIEVCLYPDGRSNIQPDDVALYSAFGDRIFAKSTAIGDLTRRVNQGDLPTEDEFRRAVQTVLEQGGMEVTDRETASMVNSWLGFDKILSAARSNRFKVTTYKDLVYQGQKLREKYVDNALQAVRTDYGKSWEGMPQGPEALKAYSRNTADLPRHQEVFVSLTPQKWGWPSDAE